MKIWKWMMSIVVLVSVMGFSHQDGDVEGKDLVGSWEYYNESDAHFESVYLTEKGDFSWMTIKNEGVSVSYEGSWELSDNREQLVMSIEEKVHSGDVPMEVEEEARVWDILSVSGDQLEVVVNEQVLRMDLKYR